MRPRASKFNRFSLRACILHVLCAHAHSGMVVPHLLSWNGPVDELQFRVCCFSVICCRFMSLMCHEVRTPLNGCLASAEMLLETPLKVRKYALCELLQLFKLWGLHAQHSVVRRLGYEMCCCVVLWRPHAPHSAGLLVLKWQVVHMGQFILKFAASMLVTCALCPPLTPACCCFQILCCCLQEEQRELANTIRVSGSILLSTVSNFLDFFKLEAVSVTGPACATNMIWVPSAGDQC